MVTAQERQEIWDQIDNIKSHSRAYLEFYGENNSVGTDFTGGHMSYDEKETGVSLCPSKEFRDRLFRKCAQELGIEYDG